MNGQEGSLGDKERRNSGAWACFDAWEDVLRDVEIETGQALRRRADYKHFPFKIEG